MKYLDPPIGDFGQNYGQRRRPTTYGGGGFGGGQMGQTGQTAPQDSGPLGDGNPYTGGMSGDPGQYRDFAIAPPPCARAGGGNPS